MNKMTSVFTPTMVCLESLEDHRGAFKRGDNYRAIVASVHPQGVIVRMPNGKGSAQISAKCWGSGEEREHALLALKPGDALDVIVKSYDARNCMLSLVLADRGDTLGHTPAMRSGEPLDVPRAVKKMAPEYIMPNIVRKPEYKPLEKGTTLLFDTANLIGALGTDHAAMRLAVIAKDLVARGYGVFFFWERRAFNWAWWNQKNGTEKKELKNFSQRKDVSIVGEEADLALLQAAEAISDSVAVTRDRLRDYAAVFPEIVATHRQRTFSVATVGDRILLSVYGLREAIVIPSCDEKQETDLATAVASITPTTVEGADLNVGPEDATGIDAGALGIRAEVPAVTLVRPGLPGVADAYLSHGDGRRAIEILGRVARKQPKFYREIADAYANGRGVEEDPRATCRYDRLADRCEKALRERKRRTRRQAAERRRGISDVRICAA